MNHRNDDDRRDRPSGQQFGQGRSRYDYGDPSERSRVRQQSQAQGGGSRRGEYYGGAQFAERTQGTGWDEDRGNWDYEGGPERYSTSGYGEAEQGYRQEQQGRQYGARAQGSQQYGGSQREYGSQGSGSSDYYGGRQGQSTLGSYGSDYNTYGRSQGYGEGSGYTRSAQPRAQQGSGFGSSQHYSTGHGGSGSLRSAGQDYLDEGEMSGYGGRELGSQQVGSSSSGRYGTAPGQYGYGGYGARSGGFRGVGPKNYMRSDARLTEDISERLTDDDDLDASDITVRVSDGKVTLEGIVDQRWMKHRAEDLADACMGVKEVDNRIQVASASSQLGQGTASSRGAGSRTSQATGTTPGGTAGTPSGGTTPH